MATVEELAKNGWYVKHQTSQEELENLAEIVQRDLRDSEVEEISLDARLGMAYNAALKIAEILLRAHGFRAGRERAHERTLDAVLNILGDSWRTSVSVMHQVRKVRNRADYESVGVATWAQVRDLKAEIERLAPAVHHQVKEKGYNISTLGDVWPSSLAK
jgi:hypothetical protein